MQNNDNLLEKLKKILRLANCQSATPGEAEAAMARASELARKHNIDLAMVNFQSDPTGSKLEMSVDRQQCGIRSKRFQMYHQNIWHVFQQLFGVEIISFRSGRDYIYFVGTSADIAVCQTLLPWLEDVFCSTYNQATSAGRLDRNRINQRSVYYGLQHGIVKANRLAEERQKQTMSDQEKNCFALVLRKKEEVIAEKMKEFFPDLKYRKSKQVDVDERAYNHGLTKGSQIRLDQTGVGPKQSQLS